MEHIAGTLSARPTTLANLSCFHIFVLFRSQLFEISDVVLLDDQNEVGARNERRLVALHSNLTSGFEVSALHP